MAKLILKSIAYYPQALAELPMSHKTVGIIDTDKPYKKLIIPTKSRHLYRLVDQQTGEVLKAQKLIRDHNDLKVYVGDVIVVEMKDFFSFQNATTVKAEEEPLYMVDAGEATCISGLISPSEGINLPEMYVLWEPVVQNIVKALGNTLATGTVSLSSNAGSDVNVTTTAPDESSKLTATVSNFVDANNTNNANKAFSNSATYQWQTSGDGLTWTNIIGDNAKTVDFTLTQSQVGQKVRVLVKNTDETGFDEYLASAATKAVNNVNQLPAGSISIAVNNGGALQQNNMLGITSNSLTDTDGMGTLSYQWQSRTSGGNFVDISGATFNTYTLTQAEVGKEIRLKASYTDGQGTAEAVFSVQTGSVVNVNDPPLGNVLINGANTPNQSFNQNQTLTATNNLSDPDNNGAAISGLTYQWQSSSNGSDWTDISGASFDSAAGVMTLTSSGGTATLAQWEAALRAVTYNNSSENPNTTQRTISFTINDGAADSTTVTSTVSVTAMNDAPTVSAPATFTVNEDTLLNLLYTGTPFADVDSTSLTVTLSIADGTIGATSGSGVTVGGTAIARTFGGTVAALNTFFTTSGNITYTGALNVNGSRTLTTSVSDSYLSNVTPSNTTINITAVNDAPVASGLASLTAVLEDTAAPGGALVSALFGTSTNFNDVDGNTLAGVAITANAATAAQGTWQWFNGTTWLSVSTTLTDTSALYLAAATSLRFAPAANFNGTPGALTARLVDSSATGLSNGTTTDVSTNGVTTAYSSATVSLATSITAVNDAPTVVSTTATLTAVLEDTAAPAGSLVSALFGANFSDVDAGNSLAGVAITANAATAAQGTWQWFNGTTWLSVSTTLTDTSALYLAAATSLRFAPAANFNGTPGALTARLVDSSATRLSNGTTTDVSTNGGTTAYSSATVSLATSITAVNDPPTLTLTTTNKTFTEGTNSTQGSDVTGIFTNATLTDAENDLIAGITLTVSNVLDGSNELLLVNNATRTIPLGSDVPVFTALAPGVLNGWGYTQSWNSGTKVSTIFLTKPVGPVSLATAMTIVESIGYRNINIDNPTPGTRVVSLTQIIDAGSGTSPNVNTSNFSTLQANINVSSVNDVPSFSSNTAPTLLTTTKSQAPSKALNIPLSGFQVSDTDGGNTVEVIGFGIVDLPFPANSQAPLNINFPNKPNSLYLNKTSDNTYSVAGTVTDLNEWLRLSNAITYNPRTSFSGTITSPIGFRVTDSLGAFANSNTFTIGVTADNLPPVFSKAVFSREANNKIILSYDEPLNTTAANLPLTSSFAVTGTTVSSLAVVGTNIILTTAANVASGTTVTYTKPGSGTAAIQDVAGNQSATTSAVTIETDTSAPFLNSSPAFNNGNAGSNVFLLNFNEELASASNSAPAGFNIAGFSVSVVDSVNPSRSGGSSTNWYQSGGSSSFSEKAFAISFNFGFLSQSASIQVKYVDPGAGNLNALKDLAGNHAGNMVLGAWTNDNLSADDSTNFIAGKSVLVVGGQGNGTMTGGLANDTFAWFAGDAGTTTGAVDIVKGFVPFAGTTGDKLDILKLLSGYTSGTSILSQWVTSITFNAIGAPSGVSATNTKIVIDVDGPSSGSVTQTIWLDNTGLISTDPNALKASGVLIA